MAASIAAICMAACMAVYMAVCVAACMEREVRGACCLMGNVWRVVQGHGARGVVSAEW